MADNILKEHETWIAQLQEEVAALRAEFASLRKDSKEPTHLHENFHHEDSTYSSESAPSGATLRTVVGMSPGSPLGLNPDPDQSVENGEITPTNAQDTPDDDEDETIGPEDSSGDLSSAQACRQDVSRLNSGVPFPTSHPGKRSILAVKLHKVKNTVRIMVASYFQPPVPPCYERIIWKCACGLLMYMDIRDPAPGVIDLLEADLSASAAAAAAAADSPDLPLQINSTFTLQQGSTGASKGSSDQQPQSPRSSLTSSDLQVKSMYSSSTLVTTPEKQVRFLLLCINATTYEIQLEQILLATVGHDQVLFNLIRDAYYKLSRSWLSKLTFLTPVSVELVKFELVPPPEGQRVGIIKAPSLPPVEEVKIKESYHYAPCPLEPPAIPKNYFMHIFHDPGKHTQDFWLRRLPKKLKTELAYTTDPLPIGWGVHIIEGPNMFLINCILVVIFAASLLWMAITDDLQGGTGLGQLLVVVLMAAVTWNLQQ